MPESGQYVFVNLWSRPHGRPWTYAAVYDLVQRLRERTGIDFGPHHYRHTYATWLPVSTGTSRKKWSGSSSTMIHTG